jgi:hypothetical protein
MQTTAEEGDRTTLTLWPAGVSLSVDRCGDPQGPQGGTFDRVLCGMVRIGLAREAICRFLLLTIEALSFHVVRLDLPTPAERLMRKPSGKRPWTDDEVRLLIKLWTANLRTRVIAERLERSAGSVRSKARRLGLFRRNRRDLIDAIAGTVPAADTTAASAPVDIVMEVVPNASPDLPTLSPNTAISDVRGAVVEETTAPIVSEIVEAPTNGIVAQISTAAGTVSVGSDQKPSARKAAKPAGRTVKRSPSRRIVWTDELSEEVARRWFAYQHHRGIAEDLGLTEAQVRSHATALSLPRRGRKKIVPDYVEGRPYDRTLEDSMVKRRCNFDHRLFWSTKNGPHTSPRATKTERYKALHSGFGEAYSTISVG